MRQRFGRLRGRGKAAVAAGLVVALALTFTGVFAILAPSRAFAAESTLTVLSGTVEVSPVSGAGFSASQDGAILSSGATVRTGKDSNAVITFFDGSTVTIEPESELVLDQVEGTSAGDVRIALTQKLGRTWHVISHKLGSGSQYTLKTPSTTASVRGTAFEATVTEHLTGIQTTDGKVKADFGGKEVEIGANQVCPLGHKLDGSELPPGATAPPTFDAVPLTAAPPPALVKIVIDGAKTDTAAAVDAQGRSVGIANGQPVRYAPGSKVETTSDGKLVMSIPQMQPGRISTVVKSSDATQPIAMWRGPHHRWHVRAAGQRGAEVHRAEHRGRAYRPDGRLPRIHRHLRHAAANRRAAGRRRSAEHRRRSAEHRRRSPGWRRRSRWCTELLRATGLLASARFPARRLQGWLPAVRELQPGERGPHRLLDAHRRAALVRLAVDPAGASGRVR